MKDFQLPPCRPLALPFADPTTCLGFALTHEPSSEHASLQTPAAQGADADLAALDDATLAQVAELLASTDVSYM